MCRGAVWTSVVLVVTAAFQLLPTLLKLLANTLSFFIESLVLLVFMLAQPTFFFSLAPLYLFLQRSEFMLAGMASSQFGPALLALMTESSLQIHPLPLSKLKKFGLALAQPLFMVSPFLIQA
jgi:hypothetical protein